MLLHDNIIMHIPIQLYSQPERRTIKIKNIGFDTVLSSESIIIYLFLFNILPQELFRGGSTCTQFLPESFGVLGFLRGGMDMAYFIF